MKKSRIKNIYIHRVRISQEEKKEISEKLTYYQSKTIKRKLDASHLSAKDKLKILYKK